MIAEKTLEKIISLYQKCQNDVSLLSEKEINLLIDYFIENSLFSEIKNTKGISILKKVISNLKIKECKKEEEILKYDDNNKKCNIFIFGNVKKKALFKDSKKLGKKNYLNCKYKCISNSIFVQIDNEFYMKYICEEPYILLKDFIHGLNKFPFIQNLSFLKSQNLFLNYEEKIYNKNEIIYKEGDEINGIYLIMQGQCKIIKENSNLILLEPKNELNIFSKEINQYKKKENSFQFINNIPNNKLNYKDPKLMFPNVISRSKELLSLEEGDLFGDLEINKKINKRQYSVISSSYLQTIAWFFSLNISLPLLNSIREISNQKYDIIQKRIESINFLDKIKNRRNELKSIDIFYSKKNTINEKTFLAGSSRSAMAAFLVQNTVRQTIQIHIKCICIFFQNLHQSGSRICINNSIILFSNVLTHGKSQSFLLKVKPGIDPFLIPSCIQTDPSVK